MKPSSAALASLLLMLLVARSGCEERCTYVFFYQPVCANDAKTYINPGHLTCETLKRPGLQLVHEGECVDPLSELSRGSLALYGVNVSRDQFVHSLAALNITLDELRAVLTDLNVTLANLTDLPDYLLEYVDVEEGAGGGGEGEEGDESYDFDDFSIEFESGQRRRVTRMLIAAALATELKHQWFKKHGSPKRYIVNGVKVIQKNGKRIAVPFPNSSVADYNVPLNRPPLYPTPPPHKARPRTTSTTRRKSKRRTTKKTKKAKKLMKKPVKGFIKGLLSGAFKG